MSVAVQVLVAAFLFSGMTEFERKILQLEVEKRTAEDSAHDLRRQIAQLEAALSRSKTTITNLEAKARRAHEAERAAILRYAECQPSEGANLEAEFDLWQRTAQCVVASYKQRLSDERAESAEYGELQRQFTLGMVRMVRQQDHSPQRELLETRNRCAQLEHEVERLLAVLGDMTSGGVAPESAARQFGADLRHQVVEANVKLETVSRENAVLKDGLRKWKSKTRELEDELATLYRRGIAAREAMLYELSVRDSAAHRVEERSRAHVDQNRDVELAKMQMRIAELENNLANKTQALAAAEQQLSRQHEYVVGSSQKRSLYTRGLVRNGGA